MTKTTKEQMIDTFTKFLDGFDKTTVSPNRFTPSTLSLEERVLKHLEKYPEHSSFSAINNYTGKKAVRLNAALRGLEEEGRIKYVAGKTKHFHIVGMEVEVAA